jgi:hypothetical protein
VREQPEAAGVHTGQHRDRDAGIEPADSPGREPESKIDLMTFECLRIRRTILYANIADIGETFRAEQFLRDQNGRIARPVVSDTVDPTRRRVLEAEPDRGHFRRRLVGK